MMSVAWWPFSPKAAVFPCLVERSGLSPLQQPSLLLPQSTHLQNGLWTSSGWGVHEGNQRESLGRAPAHISDLWGRRACLEPCSGSLSSPSSCGTQYPLLHEICLPSRPPTLRVTSIQSSQISQLGALPDLRLLFSSRRSDGQNQRFPQALDLPRVDLLPPNTASLYPKVSVPLPTAPDPETPRDNLRMTTRQR